MDTTGTGRYNGCKWLWQKDLEYISQNTKMNDCLTLTARFGGRGDSQRKLVTTERVVSL